MSIGVAHERVLDCDSGSAAECDSTYSGTSLEGAVQLNNGIQLWTVPITATYQISALGAAGGSATNYLSYHGRGTSISGEFELSEGTVLHILVGQEGSDGSSIGGGGSEYITVGIASIAKTIQIIVCLVVIWNIDTIVSAIHDTITILISGNIR